MKYKLGDSVWMVVSDTRSVERIVCPDCKGQKYITVVLGDGSKLKIGCFLCKEPDTPLTIGYPTGYKEIEVIKFSPEEVPIVGIELDSGGMPYYKARTEQGHYYLKDEEELFVSKKEAEERCKFQEAEYIQKQKDSLERKKHDSNRTWAWNISYHRESIKRAKEDIEYHTKKLFYSEKNNKKYKKTKRTAK